MQPRPRPVGYVGDGQREFYDEGRPLSFPGALRGDAAPVQLDQVLDEGQAEAEAPMSARARAIRLPEAVEDKRQHGGRDAQPRIAHHDLDMGVDALEVNLDTPFLGREFHCVHHQVPDDLLKPVWITGDRARARIENTLEANELGFRRWPDRIESFLDDGPEIDRSDVETH